MWSDSAGAAMAGWRGAAALVLAVGATSLMGCKPAGATEPVPDVCPATVQVTEQVVERAKGWSDARAGFSSKLESLSVYSGPPADKASLVPDEVVDLPGQRQRTVWKLAPSKRTYWMECGYSHTKFLLQRELGARATSCWIEVRLDVLLNGRPQVVGASCE